jgi:hypothetical protein
MLTSHNSHASRAAMRTSMFYRYSVRLHFFDFVDTDPTRRFSIYVGGALVASGFSVG